MRLFLFTLLLCFSSACSADVIKVAVYADHIDTISNVTKNKCPQLSEVDVKENQMLAEFLLFCNAIRLGGYHPTFRLIPVPIEARALGALRAGVIDVTGFGVWQKHATGSNITLSSALFDKSTFTKGLYMLKERIEDIDNKDFKTSDYIAVANQNWLVDWTLLSCAGFNVLHVNEYRHMVDLVSSGRADLFPLTFSAKPDLERHLFGVSLYPINGIKLAIDDSLHYAINDDFKDSKTLEQALDRGLNILDEKGAIEAMYKRLGIISPKSESWTKISCQQKITNATL